MGRKKKSDDDNSSFGSTGLLKNETIAWVSSIGLFVLFAFFILASFDKAGMVGAKTYSIFKVLFGLGYFLLPAVCLLLSIAFAKSIKQNFGWVRLFGSALFFVSALAL